MKLSVDMRSGQSLAKSTWLGLSPACSAKQTTKARCVEGVVLVGCLLRAHDRDHRPIALGSGVTATTEYAEVLRRADLENEPREAIAAALGLTLSNLTVRLYRARQALRRALQLSCETCPIHGYLDCGCEYSKRLRSGQLSDQEGSSSLGV